MPRDPIDILLIEDNPADIRLTQEAFRDCKVANRLQVARDGLEAMRFLQLKASGAMPDLILLDLNMPLMDGWEILTELKNNDRLKTIPVIVLTTSETEQDVLRSYQLGANSYITKPVDLVQFIRVIHSIENFWLTMVKLPAKPVADF